MEDMGRKRKGNLHLRKMCPLFITFKEWLI